MNISELFQLGNKFMTDGNMGMAVQMWQELLKQVPEYGPAHLNMAHFFRQQNNVPAEKNELNIFMDCPLTARTLEMVPNVKTRLAEIEKALNPPKT